MQQVLVVVNPASGGGALGRAWPVLEAQLRTLMPAYALEVRITTQAGHATHLVRQGLQAHPALVVAVGGDGTINEVVNGFFDGDVRLAPGAALAVLPFGTGGDFRRSLGLPASAREALAIIAAGRRRLCDVGLVEFAGPAGPMRQYFINVASAGMSGLVDRLVNQSRKRLGRFAFTLATAQAMLRYRNQEIELVLDDGPPQRLRINTLAVANARYFGGGMQIAPGAALDDGQFEVIVLGDFGLGDLVMSGRRLYQGTHVTMAKVAVQRARKVQVRPLASADLLLDVDGEQPGRAPATFTIVPGALTVVGA